MRRRSHASSRPPDASVKRLSPTCRVSCVGPAANTTHVQGSTGPGVQAASLEPSGCLPLHTREAIIKEIEDTFTHVELPSTPAYSRAPFYDVLGDPDEFWAFGNWLQGRPRDSLSDYELALVAMYAPYLEPEHVHYYAPSILIRALQCSEFFSMFYGACPFEPAKFNWPQRMAVVHYIEFVATSLNYFRGDEAEALVREWRART